MTEEAVLFGKVNSLVGIITDPPDRTEDSKTPAVLILNVGRFPRVGPNRLHVTIARTLAAMGFVVLRFDFSGIGDSTVRGDNLPFVKSAIEETREAMDFLYAVRGSERFVLMGICSGGLFSLRTACRDSRVVGALLINARGHLHGTDAELGASIRSRSLARHYWRIAFRSSFRAKNWLKAMAGKVDYWDVLKSTMKGLHVPSLLGHKRQGLAQENEGVRDIRTLIERGVRLHHVYSEGDEGLDYFHVISGNNHRDQDDSDGLSMEVVGGANHTFTLLWSQKKLLKIIQKWAQPMVSA